MLKNKKRNTKNFKELINNLEFNTKKVYKDNQSTVIEFTSKLDGIILTSSDIIEWENNSMKELKAYMNIPKG